MFKIFHINNQIIYQPMSMKYSAPKDKTKTFGNGSKTPEKSARGSQKFGHASNVSEGRQ